MGFSNNSIRWYRQEYSRQLQTDKYIYVYPTDYMEDSRAKMLFYLDSHRNSISGKTYVSIRKVIHHMTLVIPRMNLVSIDSEPELKGRHIVTSYVLK